MAGLVGRAVVGDAASAGLDSRISTVIEAAQPSLDYESFDWLRRGALSDALVWDREFGQVRDVSQLGVERNLFRYRPVDVSVRATGDASWQSLLRVVMAGIRSGSDFTVSAPVGLPGAVRRALGDQGVAVFVETEDEWMQRIAARGDGAVDAGYTRPSRVRLIGSEASVAALHAALARAVDGDPDLAVYANEVTTAGRLELLPFLHEQSITITAHRFGNPDDWSRAVI